MSSRSTRRASRSSETITEAVRGPPSRSDISPKKSLGPAVSSTMRWPVSFFTNTSTTPGADDVEGLAGIADREEKVPGRVPDHLDLRSQGGPLLLVEKGEERDLGQERGFSGHLSPPRTSARGRCPP